MIELKEVSCSFSDGFGGKGLFTAVSPLSTNFSDGGRYAIVGESGSGKTTLARMIAGLQRPSGGSVFVDGAPVYGRKRAGKEHFRKVQIIQQNSASALDPKIPVGKSIEEPLHCFFHMEKEKRRERCRNLMELCNLSRDYYTRLPSELSGGEQKRVAIARALAAEPQCLIFDEATNGFDLPLRKKIIDEIIEAYKERRGNVEFNLMPEHGNDHTLTGVSELSLKDFLGGNWIPLIDLFVAGEIKGIAGVVGCSNLTAGGHDVLSVELTKELIAKDILVLTAGCSSGGIENCGLMTPEAAKLAGPKLRAVCEKLNIPPVLNFGPCLAIGRLEIVATELAEAIGVDIPQLPLVLSAAQWLEEQALADGCFGLALGLPLHLGLPPFVTGSKIVTKVLTEDMKELTGGQVIINADAKESADILEKIIEERRSALNI